MIAYYIKLLYVVYFILIITPRLCRSGSITSSAEEDADSKIFFPGQTQEVRVSSRSKSSCVGTFCEDLDGYPAGYIDKLIERDTKYTAFFNVDVAPTIEITDRSKFDYSAEDTLCESTVKAHYPKTAVNTNNTQRIIVNTDSNRQLVMTEECNPKARCKFAESFPNNYEASCKQKFIRRRLVSIDEDHKIGPFVDTYDIPCCCVCSIKKIT